MPENKPVYLSPVGIIRYLALVIVLLLLANIALILLDSVLHYEATITYFLMKYFDFNYEYNIPSYFSVLLLAFASLLLFVIYFYKKANNTRGKNNWLLLGFIFLFLSIDENIQIHEQIAEVVRPALGNDVSGFLHWAWVVPYAVFILAVAAYFLRFVLSLPAFTRNMFFLSGIMFVGGALGLELIEGYVFKQYGLNHIYNKILYCLEELLEMSGVTLFIYALLDYMSYSNTRLALGPTVGATSTTELGAKGKTAPLDSDKSLAQRK